MKLTQKTIEERFNGLGGSDSAASVEKSPWKTACELFYEKTHKQLIPVNNEAVKAGSKLEPIVIQTYQELTGNKCQKESNMLWSKKHPWMFANIDSWIKDKNSLLEAKTTRSFDNWGEEGTDDIPINYLLQVAHYCIVCAEVKSIDYIDIAVGLTSRLAIKALLPKENIELGNAFRIYRYERNNELEEALIDGEHDFWYKHVKNNIAPPFRTSGDIELFYPAIKDKSIMASTEDLSVLIELKRLKNEESILKEHRQNLETAIKLRMKDASYITNDEDKVLCSWCSFHRKNVDTKKLKQEHPAIYNEYLNDEKIIRTFRIK